MIYPTLFIWLRLDISSDSNNKFIYVLCKILQFVLPLIYWKINKYKVRFGIKMNWRHFYFGLATGLSIFFVVCTTYFFVFRDTPLLSQASTIGAERLRSLGLHNRIQFFSYAVILSFLHSGFEEYYWRTFVFSACQKLYKLRFAVALSSVAFTAHHIILLNQYVGYSPFLLTAACSFVFIGGALWAILYYNTQNILASWVSHVLADIAIMIVLFDLSLF